MSQKSIVIKGIDRATPQSMTADGTCQEIINARFRKGCWRAVGEKEQYKSWSVSDYTEVYPHDIANGVVDGESNWIGYKKTEGLLYSIHPTTGVATLITRDATPGIEVKVVFLKRTMIVSSKSGVEIFIFNTDKKYVKVGALPVPSITLSLTDTVTETTDSVELDEYKDVAASALGDYYELLNTQSTVYGRLYGSFLYIVAYKLFDGTYILPSIPKYFEISTGGSVEFINGNGSSNYAAEFTLKLSKLKAQITNTDYPSSEFEDTKDLIESVCLFATKLQIPQLIDESTCDEDFMETHRVSSSGHTVSEVEYFKNIFPINDDFGKMIENEGWYKIHEFLFEDIVGKWGTTTEEVDTKGYYQTYATNETLTADENTHHSLAAEEAYVYNDRLHLANVKTILGDPYIEWGDKTTGDYCYGTYLGTVAVYLKTSLGQCVKVSNINIPYYNRSGLSGNIFLIPSIIGYNDSRAYKIQVTVTIYGTKHMLMEKTLDKNESLNFAYWVNPLFSVNDTLTGANYKGFYLSVSTVSSYSTATTPDEIELPFDTNRLQVSEIQDPLVFPSKNSYQIGTGDIIKIMAGSEPLSTGQFGQFPLQVFTTKGVYTMAIGTGDVLYTNILPVNGEVANNSKNIIAVGSGVVYSTVKGLYIAAGRNATEIAEIMEGTPENTVSGSTEVTTLLSDDRFTPGLVNSISKIDFLDYLEGSSIGWDQIQKELLVTNPDYEYSYVFSFESKTWHKISQSFILLINAYPKLLCATDTEVLSYSDESSVNPVEVLMITNNQHLEAPEVFKHLENVILRSKITTTTDKYAGFYVFASNDLETMQLILGKQKSGSSKDFAIQHSAGSAKSYVFVINGKLSVDSEIKQIDLVFKTMWNTKLY